MRRVFLTFLFCLMGSLGARAEWVQLHTEPEDCQASLLRQGATSTALGSTSTPLDLKAGQELLLEKDGWESLRVILPEKPTADYPSPPEKLKLVPAADGSLSRILYHLRRNGLYFIPLLAVGLLGAWRLRSKPSMNREVALKKLEDEILERGPLTLQRLGKYRLLEPFNSGGMAVLYRAVLDESLSLKDSLAVKVLKRHLCDDPAYVKRWTREAIITSKLDHPNLVSVRGAGEQDGIHFIAMDFLEGQPLSSRIKVGGIPWREAINYLIPVLDGLQAVHSAEITHRDLNPENILILPDGQVRIIDFGIARGEDFTRATKTGVVLGTPNYLAPEQLTGQLDPASDQYAVGILLYELLCGQPPFYDPDPVEVMMQHSGTQVPPLSSSVDVPSELEAIVLKMLEKKPQHRFSNVIEVKVALENLRDSKR